MAYVKLPNAKLPGRGLTQNPPPDVDPGIIPVTLDVDIATTTSLGIVIVGDGLEVTPDGVVSVVSTPAGCNTILIGEDYGAESDDCYIGVNSPGPVTVSLPVDISDGHQIVVKAEMGPPLGNRKVTITTIDGSFIDDSASILLSVPYESVHLIRRGFAWHII